VNVSASTRRKKHLITSSFIFFWCENHILPSLCYFVGRVRMRRSEQKGIKSNNKQKRMKGNNKQKTNKKK